VIKTAQTMEKSDARQLETVAVLKTLRLLQAMTGEQLQSSKGPWLLLLSLHPDHDSAY
jgi:hypothetical protein